MKDIVDKVDVASPDEFHREEFAKRVADLLFDAKRQEATGQVVGMTGPWGSGKTKTIAMVSGHLIAAKHSQSPVILMRFNPWLVTGHETLVGQFYELLWEEISNLSRNLPGRTALATLGDELRQIRRRVKPWIGLAGETAAAIDPLGVGKVLKGGIDALGSSSSLEKKKDNLTAKIAEAGISAIVLIDEIDRLSDEDIREMAKVIKSLADFRRFSYLLAYDPDRVAKALGGADIRLGHQYLEKIVQVQLRLPRALPTRLREYVLEKLQRVVLEQYYDSTKAQATWDAHKTVFGEVLEALIPDVIATPRDALRLLAGVQARLPMVEREVNLMDMIRYCALESKVPFLSERLQHLVKTVTVDGRRELRRLLPPLRSEEDSITTILGDYKDDRPLRDLLLLIFPALIVQGPEVVAKDDTSLCYETPLSTLLNCRKHPHAVSITEAENALRDPVNKLEPLLVAAFDQDLPRHAILRLRSVASGITLERHQVEQYWQRLGLFFDRDLTRESMGHYRNWLDLTHVFVRGALRNFLPQHPLSFDFIDALVRNGHIHLPARIMFFHMIAHGLHNLDRDSSLRPSLSLEQTNALMEKAANVFAQKLKDLMGQNRWMLKSMVPLWIIKSGSPTAWDDLKNTLCEPKSPETLDGVLVLLLRTKADTEFRPMKPLHTMLDLQKLARQLHALKEPRQEFRPPVVAAVQHFHALQRP
jgi:hypothetical protein